MMNHKRDRCDSRTIRRQDAHKNATEAEYGEARDQTHAKKKSTQGCAKDLLCTKPLAATEICGGWPAAALSTVSTTAIHHCQETDAKSEASSR